MTLQVPFEKFAALVEKRLGVKEAFVTAQSGCTAVTAADPSKDLILLSVVPTPVQATRKNLEAEGFEVFDGVWSVDGHVDALATEEPELYVAAVAYSTGDAKPGVWVDAYKSFPSELQVSRQIYDEFIETGELGDTSFEEFLRLATPNVVIVAPSQLRGFAAAKEQ